MLRWHPISMYLVFAVFTAKPISLQAFNNASAFLSIVLISFSMTDQATIWIATYSWKHFQKAAGVKQKKRNGSRWLCNVLIRSVVRPVKTIEQFDNCQNCVNYVGTTVWLLFHHTITNNAKHHGFINWYIKPHSHE